MAHRLKKKFQHMAVLVSSVQQVGHDILQILAFKRHFDLHTPKNTYLARSLYF